MLSAICFNLDQSRILLSDNGLSHVEVIICKRSQFGQFQTSLVLLIFFFQSPISLCCLMRRINATQNDRSGLIHMCKSEVLDLDERGRRKKKILQLESYLLPSVAYSLFILHPNITAVHNVTSQDYQELTGCNSGCV